MSTVVTFGDMDSPYLEHYGVLGMKWGVRKDGKPQGFQYGKKARKRLNREAQEFKRLRKTKQDRVRASKNRSQLSEDELDRRIARLQKEKKFRELTDSEVTPGRTFVRDFLSDNGKKIGGIVAAGAGTYFVTKYLRGK